MMMRNYRLVRWACGTVALHEVFYTDGKPNHVTQRPIGFMSDGPEEGMTAEAAAKDIRRSLRRALEDATLCPVLDCAEIPGCAGMHLMIDDAEAAADRVSQPLPLQPEGTSSEPAPGDTVAGVFSLHVGGSPQQMLRDACANFADVWRRAERGEHVVPETHVSYPSWSLLAQALRDTGLDALVPNRGALPVSELVVLALQSLAVSISTDEEHAAALREIDRFVNAEPGTSEFDRLGILIGAVHAYEEKRWKIAPGELHESAGQADRAMIKFSDLKKRWMEDPEFRSKYEALIAAGNDGQDGSILGLLRQDGPEADFDFAPDAEPRAHWNYRLIRWACGTVALHEAFYDDAGQVTTVTQDPIDFAVGPAEADSKTAAEQVIEDLRHALEDAARLPVLECNEIPGCAGQRLAGAADAIMQGLEEAIAYQNGDVESAKTHTVYLPLPRLTICPLSAEDGGGYLVEFPDFPGCIADGTTPEEAIREARGARHGSMRHPAAVD